MEFSCSLNKSKDVVASKNFGAIKDNVKIYT